MHRISLFLVIVLLIQGSLMTAHAESGRPSNVFEKKLLYTVVAHKPCGWVDVNCTQEIFCGGSCQQEGHSCQTRQVLVGTVEAKVCACFPTINATLVSQENAPENSAPPGTGSDYNPRR